MPDSALVFDLDGTLTDSDPFHFQAFVEIAKKYGVKLNESDFAANISGRLNADICKTLFPDLDESEHLVISEDKEALFRTLFVGVAPIVGLGDFLAWAKQRGCAIGLVSNAPRKNIVHMLDVLNLTEDFDDIVIASELPRGKPDPLPYVTALQRLHVAPQRAVAFEDAVPGVRSAKAAGIATVALSTTTAVPVLVGAGADLIIPDYRDASLLPFVEKRVA